MKTLRTCLNEISGLRYMFENLKLNSALGRRVLLGHNYIQNANILEKELDEIEETVQFIGDKTNEQVLVQIYHKISELNDIKSSLNLLKDEHILDDIQLFEIKKFSLISQAVFNLLDQSSLKIVELNRLEKVVELLDPEGTCIPSFYIYSQYSDELGNLRAEYDKVYSENPEGCAEIKQKCIEIEDLIRKDLTIQIRSYYKNILENLGKLAHLDILLAKANQAIELSLCKPEINIENTGFNALFNPQIKAILESKDKVFQAVDIRFENSPVLITGANMSGKTVLLKSIALAQYLFQFGFYVPAQKASISLVDEIMMSVEDKQSELNGLSSFAVEMLNINQIIKAAREGKKVLALVDELARTTNPDEGKKIVNAFVEIMTSLNVCSLITTHYSGVAKDCRRLRVSGLKIEDISQKVTIDNINNFMDYSLVEVSSDEAPKEAIRIAEILEVDDEFLNLMK